MELFTTSSSGPSSLDYLVEGKLAGNAAAFGVEGVLRIGTKSFCLRSGGPDGPPILLSAFPRGKIGHHSELHDRVRGALIDRDRHPERECWPNSS